MTEKAFSQDLRRGLGSAIVELKNSENKAAYRDIVLRYCLRDIAYDVQTEGTKGYYLYEAICVLGEKDYFEKIIAEKFLSRCNDRLLQQLTDILSCYALDGSMFAKDAIVKKYQYFASKNARLMKNNIIDEGFQWEYVALTLLEIDGFTAFKQYAIDMGTLLQKHPDRRNVLYYDWFIGVAEEIFGKKRIKAFIDKMYLASDPIKTVVDTLKEDELLSNQHHEIYKKEQVTIENIVQAAKDEVAGGINRDARRLARKFVRNATDAELEDFANIVLDEENDTVKGILLRNFSWRPFPLEIGPLLKYAQSSNEALSEGALASLEEFEDERVHALAVELLTAKRPNSSALGLLKKNYRKADDVIINELVKKMPSISHQIQSYIRDIYRLHRSAQAFPILFRVYQKGFCSFCRCDIVNDMRHCGVLPDKILEECLYDSYDDTRKFAKRLLNKRKKCLWVCGAEREK